MSEPGGGDTPLTPEEEARVARILAEAGGPLAVPPEVRARLDDVLAGLTRAPAPVVELRSRRRWPRALLAAAAVVVAGYGVGTVVSHGSLSGSGGDSTAADGAVAGSAESDTAGEGAGSVDDKARHGDESAPLPQNGALRGDMLVELRSDRLDPGVRRALRTLRTSTAADLTFDGPARPGCPAAESDESTESLPVRYDGQRAVLVAGPERDGLVEVTVYSCSGEELDRTAVAP